MLRGKGDGILTDYKNNKLKEKKKYRNKMSFFQSIAPTVNGIKLSEFLAISETLFKEVYPRYFEGNNSTIMVTVRVLEKKRQVLVYNRKCLKDVLSQRDVKEFLETLGYTKDMAVESCIERLARRMRGRKFPHEIGLFLGYPAKDVIGYMGLNSLAHNKTMGWRMYGDTSESEKIYSRYKELKMNEYVDISMLN